jgi:iron(III) transport system substrate-binding protein
VKKIVTLLLLIGSLYSLTACQIEATTLTVYTERHYDTDQVIYDLFTEETGIKVNLVKDQADVLIDRLVNEGESSPADIVMFADAGRLSRATSLELLKPVEDAVLTRQVQVGFYDPSYYWYGLTMRARVIVYHPDRVNEEEVATYEALASASMKGRIAIRSSSNLYNISWIASMLMQDGLNKTQTFLNDFSKNFYQSPAGNDRDQAKAVYQNLADVAIMNTYYLGRLLYSSDETESAVAKTLRVSFPNQGDHEGGTHINLSAAGLYRHTQNEANAIQFLQFLTSERVQTMFTSTNYEYPVHPEVAWHPFLEELGRFKHQRLDLSSLGLYHEEAFKLMIGAGWN